MIIKFIGAGDAFGSGGNFNTCFLLKTKNANLLIDCGATSLVGLNKYQIDPTDLDYVLISHLHGDHFGGIPFLLLDLLRKSRDKMLFILGPLGIQEKSLALLELLYPGVAEKLDFTYIKFIVYNIKDEFISDDFSMQVYPVIHSAPALPHALKIFADDKIIAFSGDTEWTDSLIPLSHGADLFICECNFYALEAGGHLNYQTIKANIHHFQSKKIILSHLGAEALENVQKMDCLIAHDGLEITI